MAFPLIYRRLQRGRDEDEQLKVDVYLGMPGAQARYDAQRRQAALAFGGEIG